MYDYIFITLARWFLSRNYTLYVDDVHFLTQTIEAELVAKGFAQQPPRNSFTQENLNRIAKDSAHLSYLFDFRGGPTSSTSAKIKAIKAFRDLTACSLMEAKNAVESVYPDWSTGQH